MVLAVPNRMQRFGELDLDGLLALSGFVSDADLAFDAQNQPHFAVRSTGGPLGWGLVHMACAANCQTQNANWTANQVEDTSRLGQDLPLPLPANCLKGGWFGDFRPSLAFDAAGNPRFAFDNQLWVSGCTDSTLVRTEFEAVRVVYTAQASPLAQAATPRDRAEWKARSGPGYGTWHRRLVRPPARAEARTRYACEPPPAARFPAIRLPRQ